MYLWEARLTAKLFDLNPEPYNVTAKCFLVMPIDHRRNSCQRSRLRKKYPLSLSRAT